MEWVRVDEIVYMNKAELEKEDHAAGGKAPLALFLGALLCGVYQLTHPAGFGFGHGWEMSAIAKNLATEGSFGNPFEPAITGPTAVVPPLYPAFLAILIKILRAPTLIVLAAATGNILANALTAALMPRLATVFYGYPAPGVFAGVLWIVAMRLMPQWDAGYTLAGLMAFCVFTAQTIGRGEQAGRPSAAGLMAGLISLANPATALVWLPWIVFLMVWRRLPVRYAVRFVFTCALIAVLCNVPWVIRNYSIWHAVALRTNFGMTIYSSNNDCAEPSLNSDGRNGCYQQTHPVASRVEIALLKRLGEVQYDREKTAAAIQWIGSHPDRFRQLTLARIREFWFPEPQNPAYTSYAIWAITILSIGGIAVMAKRRAAATSFVLFLWAVYPLMYYVVVSSDRYRYPILWSSLLPAGYLLSVTIGCLSAAPGAELREGSVIATQNRD